MSLNSEMAVSLAGYLKLSEEERKVIGEIEARLDEALLDGKRQITLTADEHALLGRRECLPKRVLERRYTKQGWDYFSGESPREDRDATLELELPEAFDDSADVIASLLFDE